MTGSPPLTRGKPGEPHQNVHCQRITPAHAGKTAHAKMESGFNGDHPRSRGENNEEWINANGEEGSPPLTRGKPVWNPGIFCRGRITPAHAGKTPILCMRIAMRWDHPRSRGENVWKAALLHPVLGSPPLTRGKLIWRSCGNLAMRITPAHAGKTLLYQSTCPTRQDHPRSRGENPISGRKVDYMKGSPPLTRGKPGFGRLSCLQVRITPAHAGKTYIPFHTPTAL